MPILFALISDAQGEILVNLARNAVKRYLEDATILEPPAGMGVRAGVFVTLNYLRSNREEHLRGCVGFPIAHKDLTGAVIDAAISAATADPRFKPVDLPELGSILFELSVLTAPSELTKERGRPSDLIKIGRDGLILKWKYGSGLLLPQVPVELNWDVNAFLSNICYKAGAPPDALSDPSSRLYTFQAIVFRETAPLGRVARVAF